jgi:hypothetical protein
VTPIRCEALLELHCTVMLNVAALIVSEFDRRVLT